MMNMQYSMGDESSSENKIQQIIHSGSLWVRITSSMADLIHGPTVFIFKN